MAGTILNVKFKYSITKEELLDTFGPLVEDFANLPGLQWKIWSLNKEKSEFVGVYLFEDAASCND